MKLIKNLSSNDYHAEREHYSSSQLKDMLYSPKLFYKKYITREIPREENAAFDIGTYFHTAILEPHLLKKECAVYEGTRAGSKWESFKTLHSGKAIITKSEYQKAMNCVNAIKQCPISLGYIALGTPEVSAFLTLYVKDGSVYFRNSSQTFRMTYAGWREVTTVIHDNFFIGKNVVEVGVKVRADSIDLNGVTISDLKSASGDVSDEYAIKGKTSDYSYDLSASLYLDIFSAVVGRTYKDFIWLYASKTLHEKLNAPIGKPWRADADNVKIGRAKWIKAILDIAYYQNIDWKLDSDSSVLNDLGPKEHELVWLNKKFLDPGEHELSDLSDIKRQIENGNNQLNEEDISSQEKDEEMKITSVEYQRTFKLADYENEKIGMSAILLDGEDALECVTALKAMVNEAQGTPSAAPAKEKKSEAKLEAKKEENKKEKVKEEETKKEEAAADSKKSKDKETKKKPAVTTAFEYTNDDHRAQVASTLDEVCDGWRKNADAKAFAKKLATSLTGTDFLDGSGVILPSFKELLQEKMTPYMEESDSDI